MSPFPHVLQFLVVALAGWVNQQQRDVIDYLQEENRVLREQLGPGRSEDPDVFCAQVISTTEHNVVLGTDFESGESYEVQVNDVTRTFKAQ